MEAASTAASVAKAASSMWTIDQYPEPLPTIVRLRRRIVLEQRTTSTTDKEKVKWEEITDEYYAQLEQMFKRCGPKKVGDMPYKAKWVEVTDFSKQ
jgi:hypothetical protein